ncbi:MAG: STAS/SEC14 domain-containing protein [Candidatus Sericytochromatia bacterium]
MLTMMNQRDDLVELRLKGILTAEDYRHLIQPIRHLLQVQDRLRLLVELVEFEGWEEPELRQEARFDIKLRDQLDKVAFVGEPIWEPDIAPLARELYPARVDYFANLQAARMWLEQADAPAATDVHRAASA